MDCREIGDLMMKSIDEDISSEEQEKLNTHIKSCCSCNMEFRLLKDAVLMVEELPEFDLPETFDARVMEAVKKEKSYAKGKAPVFWGIGAIGLIAFVCYIGIFVTLPFMVESGIMSLVVGYMSATFAYAMERLMNGFVETLIFIGKIFTLRDLLVNQYLNIVNVVLIVVLVNMMIFKAMRYQQE